MKLNHFKVSIIILLIGSFITKIGSFIIKVLFTRTMGVEGLSYYSIIIPTITLFITLSTMSIPLSLSKVIGENKYSSKKVIISTLLIMMIIQLFLILVFIVITPLISNYLLHNKSLSYLIYTFILSLPFITISSILKGYFLGKKKVIPNIISNIFEQIIRILFIIFVLTKLVSINLWLGLICYILLNVLTEFVSIIILNLFVPKHAKITRKDLLLDKNIVKDVFSVSIPVTSSHLVGSISFFFEPIILTNILLYNGYSINYIMSEYAVYNSYVIAILTLPSFFISAMCQLFVPEISHCKSCMDYNKLKVRIKEIIAYSFLIGFFYLIILYFQKENILLFVYHTNKGINYINILIPFFVLFYLEYPFHSIIEALGHSKKILTISLFGSFIKLLTLIIFCIKKIGIYALVYAEITNLLLVFLLMGHFLLKVYRNF